MTSPIAVPQARPRHAWKIIDVVRLYALNGVAATSLLTAWWWAAGSVRTSTQVVCVAVSIAALVVVGTANGLWLMAGRQAISVRRRAVHHRGDLLTAALLARTPGQPGPALRSAFRAVPGSQLYHRYSCPLVAGKPGARELRTADVDGRSPCGVCAP